MNAPTKIEATSIVSVLAQALPALGAVHKNKPNPAFKSKYADLGAVLAAIAPITEYGLWFRQEARPSERGIALETFYIHESGTELSAGVTEIPVNKQDAHAYGSAQSYCRRYALLAAFGLSAEDDDGNAASKTPPAQEQRQEPKQPQHSKLKTELRQFVHELEGCGDWETYCAFRDTAEFQRLTAECREKLPQYWDGSPEMPEEFVPLRRRIEILETNLGQQIADLARA